MASQRIVIVTGAGASRNLGAKGELPLMADWAGILVEDVDKAEPGLATAIGLSSELGAQEFEEVIGSFLSWQGTLGLTERFKTIGGPNPNSLFGELPLWIENSRQRTAAFTEALRTSLYREFGREAIDAEAAGTAHRRFRMLFGDGATFVYATTNYDVSIEVGLRGAGFNPHDGFAQVGWESPVLSLDDLIDWENAHGSREPVLHLHGAVGWYRQPDGRIVRQFPDQPYNATLGSPVVLPPDPNKDPVSDSSVALIWDRFRAALRGATHILVVGHSLNDIPLVNVLREASANAHLAVTHRPEDVDSSERIYRVFPGDKVRAIPMRFGPDLETDADLLNRWFAQEPIRHPV
jgi:hypothetical protein